MRVGFIGLGVMGKPMARNLLRAGFPLSVHSRSSPPVDELVAEGATRAVSPAAAAAASDVVITMLPDTPDVEAVLFGEGGVVHGAAAGSLAIDMSTIDPLATREFARRLAERDVAMLDAPVSGGDVGAVRGTLSIMVGGPPEVFERARPVFEVLGTTIVHVGPSGAGQAAKACNQLIAGANIQIVAEALVLAVGLGVDPEKVREALLGGFASSKALEVHGARMLARDFEPGFRAALMRKDARIVQEAAERVGVPLPAYGAVAERLRRLVEAGMGDLDTSALVRLLEEEVGVELGPGPGVELGPGP